VGLQGPKAGLKRHNSTKITKSRIELCRPRCLRQAGRNLHEADKHHAWSAVGFDSSNRPSTEHPRCFPKKRETDRRKACRKSALVGNVLSDRGGHLAQKKNRKISTNNLTTAPFFAYLNPRIMPQIPLILRITKSLRHLFFGRRKSGP